MDLQIPIKQPDGAEILFTSPLNRKLLRESEQAIISKFSMKPQRDMVVFGIPLQFPTAGEAAAAAKTASTAQGQLKLKQAVFNVTTKLSEIQEQYTGRLENEVLIDPIAIYLELGEPITRDEPVA